MTTVDQDNATNVATRHAESLELWQEIIDEFGYRTEQKELRAIIEEEDDGPRSWLAWRALEIMENEGRDVLDWYHDISHALDVEITGRLSEGRWELSGVALLVCFGGPTVRYVALDDSTIRVEVAWWGDEASRLVECDLASDLWQRAENDAEVAR